MENKYVIKINQVTKQFKSVFAVKNLSLNIEKNERSVRRRFVDKCSLRVEKRKKK